MRIWVLLAGLSVASSWGLAADGPTSDPVRTAELRAEIQDFLGKELAAHLSAIPTVDPPPDRVWGALTTGKFTWGTFMRSLSVYRELTGVERLGDRDMAPWIARMGLLEARGGGVAFAQLYPALALRSFGANLERNAVWRSLGDKERPEWGSLLDATRFYDPEAKTLGKGTLSENYYGVAARIESVAHDVGLRKDRRMLDDLLDLAARQFTSGTIYADDKAPVGCYDRYSNEYARTLWVSAHVAGRKDIVEALRPSLRRQMRLWWDVVAPDGYGTPWGRTIGLISYLDTMEIVGFLAENPEFRPAPMPQLAALFHQAWRSLRKEYRDERHLLDVFAFGRGSYYYIKGDQVPGDREWQQTTSFFGKVGDASLAFFPALEREGLAQFPARPTLPEVARFELYRQDPRPAGLWVVRQGPLRFALPIVTGNMRPALSDYMPAPHGLPGFAAPVERHYPSMASFIELEDGRTIVATDGADEIRPAADGQSLEVVWRRFARVGAKHSEPQVEPGFKTRVVFRIDGDRLLREETLTASRDVAVRRFSFAVPTTAARVSETTARPGTKRRWAFASPEATLEVGLEDGPLEAAVWAPGDAPEGQAPRRGVPLHLQIETRSTMILTPARPFRWSVWLRVGPPAEIRP
jgi:hypothetical protein